MSVKKEAPKQVTDDALDQVTHKKGKPKSSGLSFENHHLYNQKVFTVLSITVCLLLCFMSFDFGVNGDEKFQVNYSKKLWNYYSTFGKDTSALYVPEGNMHLYGGLFDLTAISLNKLMGLDNEFTPEFHYTRRVLCAVFGFIAMLFASLFARQIGGWPLAFMTLVFMLFSPRFFGDSMVNPKDIPFAAGYIMALFFISRFIRELPRPGIGSMAGIILGVMIALNTRAGGLLLIVYLFFFTAVFLARKALKNDPFTKRDIIISGLYTLGVGFLAYLAGILFWPYALTHPFTHPLKALSEFTSQPITMTVLFGGAHINSGNLPWNYLPEWIIRTVPLFSIFGLFFFIRLLKKREHDIPFLELFILVFAALFPIVYAIFKQATLHDGWRHFIFIYPPLVLIAAVGWFLWFTSFRSKSFRIVSFVLLAGLLSENLFALFSLHPYQYAYFNPLFGGIKKAYGNFETDYWMLSVKEASNWLKKQERVELNKKANTVVTNGIYPAQVYLGDTANKIKLNYTAYYDRSEKYWDYALFYSRFIHRNQLLNRSWPPEGTIHIVRAGGIPVCAVVKRENQEDYLGFEAMKRNDYQSAMNHLVAALEYAPYNETVSYALAIIYKSTYQYDKAERAIEMSLNAYPDNPAGIQLLRDIKIEKANY